jgi:hypothetical protein
MSLFVGCCCFCTAFVFACFTSIAQDDENIEQFIRGYSINSEFASAVTSDFGKSYFELSESQSLSIEKTKREFQEKANGVIGKSELGPIERLRLLQTLRQDQDNEIKKQLLPRQVNQIDCLTICQFVNREGLSHSLVSGALAIELSLSVPERKRVRDVSVQLLEEYERDLLTLQRESIAKLEQSLPLTAVPRFQQIMEGIKMRQGFYWNPNSFMLNPENKSNSAIIIGLPALDE